MNQFYQMESGHLTDASIVSEEKKTPDSPNNDLSPSTIPTTPPASAASTPASISASSSSSSTMGAAQPSPVLKTLPAFQRISVLDKNCFCPLFDKVWKWKEEQKSPALCAGLIRFFYQFASDFDDGIVNRVSFEPHSGSGRAKYNPWSTRCPPRRVNRSNNRGSLADVGSVEMYCAHNDAIIVALFVTPSYPNAEIIAQLLVESFSKQFRQLLESKKSHFLEAASNLDTSVQDLSFLAEFSSFEEAVNKLAVQ